VIDFVNKPVARLILVGLPALALQTTFFAEVKIFGVVLQIMLALSIAAGLAGGSENGALAGFVFGLMFDLVLTSPLGLSALVWLSVSEERRMHWARAQRQLQRQRP
jgi:cell shape-determining protein MreD